MELREAFRILDKENEGTISVSVLKGIIKASVFLCVCVRECPVRARVCTQEHQSMLSSIISV